MTIWILTLFPEFFENFTRHSIIKRAISKKLVEIKIVNIRDFATDTRKTVDDTPYGGGAGMVMKVDVLHKALKSIKPKPHVILLSASGNLYTQKLAKNLIKHKNIALICGHYEGIDARIEKYVDNVISIGDYVLTGGEIPAMILIDTVTRLIPGAINKQSTSEESFSKTSSKVHNLSSILEYPQFTRPEQFNGQKVPKVLLSGNHKEIKVWREKQSKTRTKKFRPDLLKLTPNH